MAAARRDSVDQNTHRPSHWGEYSTHETSILNTSTAGAYDFSYLKILFVIILFIVSLISFVTQTELTSLLYTSYKFDEPILLLFLNHGSWWILWIIQFTTIAVYKTIKKFILYKRGYYSIPSTNNKWKGFRRSFASSVKAQHQNIFHTAELTTASNISDYRIIYTDPKKSFRYYKDFFKSDAFKYIFQMSALLSIILNIAGVTWFIAMGLSTGSDVTAIYNCSAFTAYIFAIPILKEKFSWIKANSVLTAIIGVFIVAYMGKSSSNSNSDSDSENQYPHRLIGNFIILLGAVLYGLYEVFYKKWCCPPSEEVSARKQATFSNFIMCLMGINTFIIMGCFLLITELSGFHHFKFPDNPKVVLFMFLSIVSNHLFSVSFLGLMSLTSPVFSSVASLLTILIVGVFEYLFRGVIITLSQISGYCLIMVGFSLLTYASWNEISKEDIDDDAYITDSESVYSSTSSQNP